MMGYDCVLEIISLSSNMCERGCDPTTDLHLVCSLEMGKSYTSHKSYNRVISK